MYGSAEDIYRIFEKQSDAGLKRVFQVIVHGGNSRYSNFDIKTCHSVYWTTYRPNVMIVIAKERQNQQEVKGL